MEYKTRKGGTSLGMVCSNMVISPQEGSHTGIGLCRRDVEGVRKEQQEVNCKPFSLCQKYLQNA
jgi:hypothetical protein